MHAFQFMNFKQIYHDAVDEHRMMEEEPTEVYKYILLEESPLFD